MNRFFTRLDWAAFWTATLLTFLVYFLTLGPSVGLEDAGELATAAANLGVPHPPGYPFWTFCSWIFCRVFSFVTYMGHPTPAWCVSLCSAVFGALAAGCTAMLICRSSRDFTETSGALSFGGGVAGALTFALSPVEWSQSTIVEIYSLNAFFLMWVFLLSYRWMRKPSDKMLFLTAFVFGLGLTNYQVLLFAIVPLALIIAMKDLALFRDVFLYLIPVALTWQLLQIGQLYRADHLMQSDAINKHLPLVGKAVETPQTAAVIVGLALLVAALVASAILFRRRAALARKVLAFGGGAGVLVLFLSSFVFTTKATWAGVTAEVAPLIAPTRYALIAACLAASVVAAALSSLRRLGESETDGAVHIFQRLAAQVNRELVAALVFGAVAWVIALDVPVADAAGYLGVPYPWGKSTAVFALLLVLLLALAAFMRTGLSFAIPVAALHLSAFTLLTHGAMNGLTHPCSWWFGWPLAWNFVLLALAWVTLPNGRRVAGAAFFAQLGVSFYVYMPIVSDLRNPPMNWGYPRTWEGFKHAIMRGQYEAIGFQMPRLEVILNYLDDVRVQFTDLLIPFALVPFVCGRWIVKKENRKAFWQWMIPALACFLLMSVLLIGLANVKGDLQDGFIQKVKFISSHAMLALWIGYGLVFAAVALLRFATGRGFSRPRLLTVVLSVTMIVVSFVYPLIDNYCGTYRLGVNEVAFKLGGSEQNGHTFGWQFGAYQLDGAAAIREQLVADEEPLPDPDYPPAMERFSIFFGGTDPGRFVPTYMIYSALLRPDVYLITQNALADSTYMAVERDLYGDEIWIPSEEDSAEAFNIYIDEVQRGIRPANGDMRIENGRVQVTGALGVMEINGILTKMMHEHDRLRHAFYVEESYVIPWMYPYLSPHGLIMKLNAEKTSYDAKLAAKDRDFWDWYTRRLLDDGAYRRDFAAQKSFSKLRAAIAGLYNKQGRYRDSSQAFREACLLYPASPEATFRYAQEILLPFRRHDVVLELLDYTDEIDPNNRRTQPLRDYVARMALLRETLAKLEPRFLGEKPALSDAELFVLARTYYELGRTDQAGEIVSSLVERLTDANALRVAAQLLMDAKRESDAEQALTRYLKLQSRDVQGWLDLARIQSRAKKGALARQSFLQAYRLDKNAVFKILQADQEIYDLARPLFR